LTRNQDFDLDVHGAKFHDDSPRFFKLYQFWQGDRLTLSLDDRPVPKNTIAVPNSAHHLSH
jgi:hypothetical protein